MKRRGDPCVLMAEQRDGEEVGTMKEAEDIREEEAMRVVGATREVEERVVGMVGDEKEAAEEVEVEVKVGQAATGRLTVAQILMKISMRSRIRTLLPLIGKAGVEGEVEEVDVDSQGENTVASSTTVT